MTDTPAEAALPSGFNYDEAWAARLDVVQRQLAEGPCGARRLLAAIARHERHFQLATQRNGPPVWFRRQVPASAATWPHGLERERMSSLKGTVLPVPAYARFRLAELLGDLVQHYGPFDTIAELGCGSGRNLFELHDEIGTPALRYVGGEFAAAGLDLAREIARHHEAAAQFGFARFDHTEPDLAIVGTAGRAFLFTVHSIEQVHRLPLDYFHKLAAAAPAVVGIHVEPFGFQVDAGLGPATRQQAREFVKRRWNTNLHHALRRAEADGAIVIDHLALECFLPDDAFNPSSLVVWHRR